MCKMQTITLITFGMLVGMAYGQSCSASRSYQTNSCSSLDAEMKYMDGCMTRSECAFGCSMTFGGTKCTSVLSCCQALANTAVGVTLTCTDQGDSVQYRCSGGSGPAPGPAPTPSNDDDDTTCNPSQEFNRASCSSLLSAFKNGNACLKAGYTSHNYDSSTSCCQWLEGEAVNVDVTCTPEGSGVQFQCSGAISVAPNSLLVVLLGFIAVAVQAGL